MSLTAPAEPVEATEGLAPQSHCQRMSLEGRERPRYDPSSYVPLNADVFHFLLAALGTQGVEDLEWSEAIEPPSNAEAFASEIIFVICNSGMKNTVAAGIFERCMKALKAGIDVRQAFRHPGKSAAIAKTWAERTDLFYKFQQASDRLVFLAALPWIGDITKYHLAKNFGVDVAKPDVHLQRLADRDGSTPHGLCARIAAETGLRVATVDTILWRACANGILDSKTGVVSSIEHLNAIRELQDRAWLNEQQARCSCDPDASNLAPGFTSAP